MANRKKKKERLRAEYAAKNDQRKARYILLVILVLLSLGVFAGGIALIAKDISLKNRCTASAVGGVVRVDIQRREYKDLKRRIRRYSTSYTTYIAVDDSIFPEKEIVLKTGGYKEGQFVKVYYDPDDYSCYYVDGTSADRISGGITLIVLGALLLLFSGWLIKLFVKNKRQKT